MIQCGPGHRSIPMSSTFSTMKKIRFVAVPVLILIYSIMNFSKKKNRSIVYKNWVSLTGNTRNISGQAAVVSDSIGVYYVDGLGEWEKDWLHQTVMITGDLERRVRRTPDSFGEDRNSKSQEAPAMEKIIKSAVVMLLYKEPGYDENSESSSYE